MQFLRDERNLFSQRLFPTSLYKHQCFFRMTFFSKQSNNVKLNINLLLHLSVRVGSGQNRETFRQHYHCCVAFARCEKLPTPGPTHRAKESPEYIFHVRSWPQQETNYQGHPATANIWKSNRNGALNSSGRNPMKCLSAAGGSARTGACSCSGALAQLRVFGEHWGLLSGSCSVGGNGWNSASTWGRAGWQGDNLQ